MAVAAWDGSIANQWQLLVCSNIHFISRSFFPSEYRSYWIGWWSFPTNLSLHLCYNRQTIILMHSWYFRDTKITKQDTLPLKVGHNFVRTTTVRRPAMDAIIYQFSWIIWHGIFEMMRGHGHCMNKTQTAHIHTHISIIFLVVLIILHLSMNNIYMYLWGCVSVNVLNS